MARARGRRGARGRKADETAFRKAAEVALADARPSGDNAFKIELAKRMVVRALRSPWQERPTSSRASGFPLRLRSRGPSPCLRPIHPISPNLRYGSNSGQPLTRRDGILKVTGRATYAADNHPEGMLYAVCAVSSIARGRVALLDVEAAKAHPGSSR